MDSKTREDLRFQVRRKITDYIEKSNLPMRQISDHQTEVVCPNCGHTAIVTEVPMETQFEFWKCASCGKEGDAISYARYHLRARDEDAALLDVCRKLDVSIPGLITIKAKDLMDQEFPPLVELIEGMLAPGLYLLAGAPKIGKSWLVLQIAHHVSTGMPLWDRKVMQHAVLYLSLEDTLPRIQRRLLTICDGKTGDVAFATEADMLGDGFEKQLTSYLEENTDTKVVIVDTLAKVRGIPTSSNVYSSDYATMNIFKHFADTYKIALILVHHTRKQESDDAMEKISGTNGLMGCADGAMVLERPNRSKLEAILTMTSRDFEDARINLRQNETTMCWEFAGFDDDQPADNSDPVLEALARFVLAQGAWKGTAQNLVIELQKLDPKLKVWPNTLSRRLNSSTDVLHKTYGVRYSQHRTEKEKLIELESMTDMSDMFDNMPTG